ASFTEIRKELDSCEAQLIESLSNLNICAVGDRYAIVPHALGPVDFRVRTQRNDHRIVWTDSLEDARDKALAMSRTRHAQPSPVAATPSAPAEPDQARDSESLSSFTLQVVQINQRLSRLETDVANIYRSRIWRTLVKIGAVINAVFGSRFTRA